MTISIDRRRFLERSGLAIAAGAIAGISCDTARNETSAAAAAATASKITDDWASVREQFNLLDEYAHLSALFISSHPRPVREAIDRYRRELDESPVLNLTRNNRNRRNAVLEAAAGYLGVRADEIALTDSTTMGIGLVYNGLRLEEGDELLTTEHDYYVTHEALRVAAARSGASVREIPLFDDTTGVSAEAIVQRLSDAIRPETRVLALTWVHSSTGLKLPLAAIGDAIDSINGRRDENDRVLICVDGVHGFGVEDVRMADLGCDFFVAGCHKWLFGPRGTGIICATGRTWARLRPSIPSFIDDGSWEAWMSGDDPGPTTAARMTPGGFKAFEHQWAMAEAFQFHQDIGKDRIAARTHELARQLKEGLAGMSHVQLISPMSDDLSAGIVSFDVNGMNPWDVVRRLRDRRIIATVTPYAQRHARLTPSIRNSPGEIDAALAAIRDLT
jgi:isopenicillin-N epimerase